MEMNRTMYEDSIKPLIEAAYAILNDKKLTTADSVFIETWLVELTEKEFKPDELKAHLEDLSSMQLKVVEKYGLLGLILAAKSALN